MLFICIFYNVIHICFHGFLSDEVFGSLLNDQCRPFFQIPGLLVKVMLTGRQPHLGRAQGIQTWVDLLLELSIGWSALKTFRQMGGKLSNSRAIWMRSQKKLL